VIARRRLKSAEERDERLELVRLAQAMILQAFGLCEESAEN